MEKKLEELKRQVEFLEKKKEYSGERGKYGLNRMRPNVWVIELSSEDEKREVVQLKKKLSQKREDFEVR